MTPARNGARHERHHLSRGSLSSELYQCRQLVRQGRGAVLDDLDLERVARSGACRATNRGVAVSPVGQLTHSVGRHAGGPDPHVDRERRQTGRDPVIEPKDAAIVRATPSLAARSAIVVAVQLASDDQRRTSARTGSPRHRSAGRGTAGPPRFPGAIRSGARSAPPPSACRARVHARDEAARPHPRGGGPRQYPVPRATSSTWWPAWI
jgi:hypothetical protein